MYGLKEGIEFIKAIDHHPPPTNIYILWCVCVCEEERIILLLVHV